jgi:tRNA 2-thiouridine synthesizing protein B
MMLHTINKSPFERNSLDACLRMAKKGSAILFFEDGVIGALKGTVKSDQVAAALADHAVYVLGPDLAARGMSEDSVIDGVKVVDYAGFVDLSVEHDKVQAWV